MSTYEAHANQYDQSFELRLGGEAQVFDSFECAFYAVAPTCVRCDRRITGYGIEARGLFFCGSQCAQEYDVAGHPSPELGEALENAGERL
jgi:hypothetical protein